MILQLLDYMLQFSLKQANKFLDQQSWHDLHAPSQTSNLHVRLVEQKGVHHLHIEGLKEGRRVVLSKQY